MQASAPMGRARLEGAAGPLERAGRTCEVRLMPAACLVDRLLIGRRALEARRWEDARAAFEDALAEQESADARDGLGQALWFVGRVEEGIAAREHAFSGYVHERRCGEAARVAVWISHQYFISGRTSARDAMLGRAQAEAEMSQLIPRDQRIRLRCHESDEPIDMIE